MNSCNSTNLEIQVEFRPPVHLCASHVKVPLEALHVEERSFGQVDRHDTPRSRSFRGHRLKPETIPIVVGEPLRREDNILRYVIHAVFYF